MAFSVARFLPAGESAVLIELGEEISLELNARVLALDRALRERPFDGYLEAIPTYRSLLVFLDPARSDLEAVRAHVSGLSELASKEVLDGAVKTVPTVYDGEDLDEVARLAGLSRAEVVRRHSERVYRVFMIGFTPGFAYMGPTDEKLAIGRRRTPRPRVPAGSVAIAMGQTAVYPSATPGGWRLLGRAEHRNLFDVGRDPPSLFQPGDRVRFVPVEALPPFSPPSRPTRTPPRGDPVLEVEEPGLLTTIQDLGRPGYQRFGVPVAGAVDAPALGAANRLVGNPRGAAALECTIDGPRLRCLRTTFVAVTGADLGAVVERSDLGEWRPPRWSSFLLRPGNALRFEGRVEGARAYVALAGGIDVPEVLGSRSTYLAAALGGLAGRALARGDRLSSGPAPRRLPSGPSTRVPRPAGRDLRVVLGPQEDHFDPGALSRFTSAGWVVRPESDRMGCRLEGPRLAHAGSSEIVSDGMAIGSVQVPPDGKPIVMLADRATTGGYPKIATVIAPDLARIGQAFSGDVLRFRVVSLEEARRVYRESLGSSD